MLRLQPDVEFEGLKGHLECFTWQSEHIEGAERNPVLAEEITRLDEILIGDLLVEHPVAVRFITGLNAELNPRTPALFQGSHGLLVYQIGPEVAPKGQADLFPIELQEGVQPFPIEVKGSVPEKNDLRRILTPDLIDFPNNVFGTTVLVRRVCGNMAFQA